MRQNEGPPHATVPAGELEGQVKAELDKHVPSRQTREAPAHGMLHMCMHMHMHLHMHMCMCMCMHMHMHM